MKFSEHKLFMETARLPSPVQKWFGHQLEIRGIDSVIYSRHVIHLLQQDDEEIQDYVDLFFDSKADKKHQCKPGRYDKKKINSEERKKSAAIECLQAVSDEDNDIEKLVEELCHKLKTLEQHDGVDGTNGQEQNTSSSESDCSSSEFENPAERYYAAFPALQGNDNHTTPTESLSVWRNNPMTKSKPDQTGEMETGVAPKDNQPKHQQQDQLSPKTPQKKKDTVQKLHTRKSPSQREDACYKVCRFLSWPNETNDVENPDAQTSSLNDKERCSQVESMLKEMLLKKKEKPFKVQTPSNQGSPTENIDQTSYTEITRETSPRGTDGSVSPELQEDDSWYTQPIDILFTSEEPRQRLYKRNNSSSASPLQQKSGTSTPVSPNGSLTQQSFMEDDFLFHCSTSNTSETGFSDNFPADLSHSLFNPCEPEAVLDLDTALNPDQSSFLVFSPYDNLPHAATTTEREESPTDEFLTQSSTENNLNSLTTVSDLEDIDKRIEDLDLDETLAPETFLNHHYNEQIMNSPNNEDVYWDDNLQSYGFLPSATTWPSKVLVGDLTPGLCWGERNEGYSTDFYSHLKFGKIWQVWDVNYQKITGAYCSPLKNPLHTCYSDCVLFGLSSCWDPCNSDEQTEIWSSWGDYEKLKDSYGQSLITGDLGSVETYDDTILQEDPCNPLVMVDVDQDSVVCQLENQNSELIPQIQFDVVSEAGSDYDNVLSDGEDDQLANSEENHTYYRRSASFGDFQTMWSMVEHSPSKNFSLARSFELVPSERSAFVNVVQKKIHHVQSEPNLRRQRRDSLTISPTNEGRSCKSDSSSPEEHLYFSKKTHFQPIQSPVAQNTGSTYNLRDLFGGYAPSKTPYQKFQEDDTYEVDEKENSFIPMFKIRKDQGKYIQANLESTDDDAEATECDGTAVNHQQFEQDRQIFSLFGYVENFTGSLQATPQNLGECVNTCVDSGYEDLDQHVQEKEEAERVVFYDGPTTNKKQVGPWSMKYGFSSIQDMHPLEELAYEEAWQSVRTSKPHDYSDHAACACGKEPVAGDLQENASSDDVCKPPVHGWVIQEAWGSTPGIEGQSEAISKHSIWSSGHEDGVFSEMFYYSGHGEETAAEQYVMDDSSSSKVDDCSEEIERNLLKYHQDVVDKENENDCSVKIIDEPEQCDREADSDPYGQSFMELRSYFGDDLSEGSTARSDQQCAGLQDKENDPPKDDSDIVKVKLVIKKGKKKQDFEDLDTQPPLFMPMPVSAVYSCELEHAWMNNTDEECVSPQSVKENQIKMHHTERSQNILSIKQMIFPT
ncbi:uncharacterized protein LOC125658490 isoform X4 [Ostrea edulis]|uniref:uncharacterized protein LOC125658490 isoform X4 n=1 Tax=Ostrea edulis TaxID=37623 RepID=UPI0024AF527A|nr:uncharacterized protein LOC125658490 isoform X4 [Ostrea edulis]